MIPEKWTVWGAQPDGRVVQVSKADRTVKQIRALALAQGLRVFGFDAETRPASLWRGEAPPSVGSGTPDIWHACAVAGVDFWAVDNGFFRAPAKGVDVETCYLRIGWRRPMPRFRWRLEVKPDRFASFGVEIRPWRTNKQGHILLCPPRGGLARYYGIREEDWIARATEDLPSQFRDRVRVRRKGDPGTISDAIDGALVVVSHSSRVAFDALLAGVPAVETDGMVRDWNGFGPEHVGREDLAKPDRLALFRYAAWCQFTHAEMRSGFAWWYAFQLQVGSLWASGDFEFRQRNERARA